MKINGIITSWLDSFSTDTGTMWALLHPKETKSAYQLNTVSSSFNKVSLGPVHHEAYALHPQKTGIACVRSSSV